MWTVLYPIIFVTFGFVFIQALRGQVPWWVALPFGINLATNVSFTPILFGQRNLRLATGDILIVLTSLFWAVVVIWPHYPLVAIVQTPYLVWVGIATVLQVSITRRNRSRSAELKQTP